MCFIREASFTQSVLYREASVHAVLNVSGNRSDTLLISVGRHIERLYVRMYIRTDMIDE